MTWTAWETNLQISTERFLTWRKRRRIAKKEKQKKKNPILDWAEAIGSAVLIVLLINQYLLQAYQIPSPSMVSTLQVGDRIFVNKLVYGPELIPGMVKIPGFDVPRRGQVIIFESPEYLSMGPAKDILQRVLYMVTLSLVDIDRDENGNPKHHFLIKRAVGVEGDRIRLREGNVDYLLPGESDWIPEESVKKDLGFDYHIRRTFSVDQYPAFRKAGMAIALEDAGLPVPEDVKKAASGIVGFSRDKEGRLSWQYVAYNDTYYVDQWRSRTRWALEPYNAAPREDWRTHDGGIPVPLGRIFPMGDNRDDSRDARYFGAVKTDKVLGRALVLYWPLGRLGGIR